MPQPRQPVEKLRAKGSAIKNPALFRDRVEPKVIPLGEPSPHMKADARVAWYAFKAELAWLAESDRAVMEIACHLRGKLLAGEDVNSHSLTVLRQCLNTMGATPADRSKIRHDEGERVIDPIDKFFQ